MYKIKEQTIEITLEGMLQLENVHQLKELFQKHFERDDNILLDFEHLTSISVSCIQMIFAACWYAQKLGKKVQIKSNWPSEIQQTIKISGYWTLLQPYILSE